MKRPVSLDRITKSFEQRFQNGNGMLLPSVVETIDSTLSIDRFGIFQFNVASKNNFLLGAIKGITPLNYNLGLDLYRHYIFAGFDIRADRYFSVMSTRENRTDVTSDIVQLMPFNEWKVNQEMCLHRRRKTLYPTQVAKGNRWFIDSNDLILNDKGKKYILHLTTNGDVWSNVLISGRLRGNDHTRVNSALCSFRFFDSEFKMIVADSVNHHLKGLYISEKVGWFSYLKTDEQGFFIFEFKIPSNARFVELSFRTWAEKKNDIVID
ncbi:MAG: hypothetical protein QF817_06270, partial [Candidatus Poseidoniaceae archaeon]|nr:hypothetical protein [Candidatus Poseidoniaceae archaeon]